jgi:hypothetical protein
MKRTRVLKLGLLSLGLSLLSSVAFAQLPVPRLPGFGRKKDPTASKDDGNSKPKKGEPEGPKPAGVPIPADSPLLQAFSKMQQQSSYHQKITIATSDPQIQQVMAQMGFSPTETITAGNMKQVSVHIKMPLAGKVEDMELRTVVGNGRMAKIWISPGSDRFLKEGDANLAKQLARAEAENAKSIAKSLAMGPAGLVSAAVQGAAAAANVAEAAAVSKQAHDFFKWTCQDSNWTPPPAEHTAPPPLFDQRTVGDDTIDGVAVTTYEMYVKDNNGKFQGPVRISIAKDSGLPARLAMSDPSGRGSMNMDYFGFNQTDAIEVPACMQK